MSGESDYVELVTHLRAEGVRVEIASVRHSTAQILIDKSDYMHDITSDDWFVYKTPKITQNKKK